MSENTYQAALELCERAESEMVALEMALHEYRSHAAQIVQCLRARQHADGLAGKLLRAKERRRENRLIATLHAHDAAVMRNLLGRPEATHAA